MPEQNNLYDALFRVTEPKTPKHPSFKGSCTIDLQRYCGLVLRDFARPRRAGIVHQPDPSRPIDELAPVPRLVASDDDDIPF
jgi:hypothetical protein